VRLVTFASYIFLDRQQENVPSFVPASRGS
jgi:hypothetical protein